MTDGLWSGDMWHDVGEKGDGGAGAGVRWKIRVNRMDYVDLGMIQIQGH